jgi:hypothetical protein
MDDTLAIHPHSIAAAAQRIAGHVRHTPLLRLPGAALGLSCAELWLKLPLRCRCSSFSHSSAQSTPSAAPGSFSSGVRRMWPCKRCWASRITAGLMGLAGSGMQAS